MIRRSEGVSERCWLPLRTPPACDLRAEQQEVCH
jgi:hypothetical protein